MSFLIFIFNVRCRECNVGLDAAFQKQWRKPTAPRFPLAITQLLNFDSSSFHLEVEIYERKIWLIINNCRRSQSPFMSQWYVNTKTSLIRNYETNNTTQAVDSQNRIFYSSTHRYSRPKMPIYPYLPKNQTLPPENLLPHRPQVFTQS